MFLRVTSIQKCDMILEVDRKKSKGAKAQERLQVVDRKVMVKNMRNLVGYQDLPEEIRNQINEVTEIWKKRVMDHLVGVYLHGSISLEAFHPESGDIDILVVVKDSLTVEEKLDIAKDIIEIDGHPRPIEISAIKEKDAKNWKTPGNCVFHYSDF